MHQKYVGFKSSPAFCLGPPIEHILKRVLPVKILQRKSNIIWIKICSKYVFQKQFVILGAQGFFLEKLEEFNKSLMT